MSVFFSNNSSKNIFRNNISPVKSGSKIRKNSVENPVKNSKVKGLYKKDNYNKNLLVLNYIMKKSEKRNSLRTNFSDSIFKNEDKKYDLSMVNKYEENLNSSLSFISEFDLENDNNNDKVNNSFNSENNDDSVEIINIDKKYKINLNKKRNEEDEIDFKLDQDFIEIKKNLSLIHQL